MLPPGDSGENKDDFIELQTQLIEDLRPEGILEGMQVEKIAVCYWRLRRAIRCEVGEIRKDQEMISIRSAFTDETLSPSELTNDVQTFENVSKRVKKAIDAILPHMQGLEKSGHEYMDRKFMEALNESHSE